MDTEDFIFAPKGNGSKVDKLPTVLPTELEPISNHILFQFLDETNAGDKGAFVEQTDWGFHLGSSLDDTTKAPRWVEIIALGPEAPDYFHVGQIVLVEPLQWTRQVEYDGVTFARTDADQIIAVDDDT